jgi:hypothetical protein
MRQKVWTSQTSARPNQAPELADRIDALLMDMAGGEGGGAPCSVGVPPWFLKAAHSRLADLTRGTPNEDYVQAVFSGEAPISPDKLALALAVIDEAFVGQIADQSASE